MDGRGPGPALGPSPPPAQLPCACMHACVCVCVCVCERETRTRSVPGCVLVLPPQWRLPGHSRLFLPEAGLFTSQAASPACTRGSSGLLGSPALLHTRAHTRTHRHTLFLSVSLCAALRLGADPRGTRGRAGPSPEPFPHPPRWRFPSLRREARDGGLGPTRRLREAQACSSPAHVSLARASLWPRLRSRAGGDT